MKDPARAADTAEERQSEQEGLDIKCKIDSEAHEDRMSTHKANEHKAFAMVHSCCNKTIQSRIKEWKNCKSEMKNDPFKMLEVIKLKTHGQAQAKCECTQATDTSVQFVNTK